MEQRHVVSLFSRVVGLTLVGLLLSGCPSVYVKTTAGTFTAAGKEATKAIKDTSDRLDTALDARKAVTISGDSSCPIQQSRVFVRVKKNELAAVNAATATFPLQASTNDCKALIRCAEENAGKHGTVSDRCKKACYSKEEGACLAAFEAEYAKSLAPSGDEVPQIPKQMENEIKQYKAFLVSSEFQRAGSIESQLVGPSLKALTEYLDLLTKASEERKSEVGDDAKKLADNIGKLTANIDKVREKQLSDEDKKTQAQAQGVINSIGKLAATLDKIAKDAQDEKIIRSLVKSNEADVEQLIEHLRNVTTGNNYAAIIKQDAAVRVVRDDLQAQYAVSTSMRERRMLLAERETFKFSNGDETIRAIDEVFTSLSKAHTSLVTLVNDPTDEQKRKMAEQRFEVFKSVVSDVVDVAAAVK